MSVGNFNRYPEAKNKYRKRRNKRPGRLLGTLLDGGGGGRLLRHKRTIFTTHQDNPGLIQIKHQISSVKSGIDSETYRTRYTSDMLLTQRDS